MRIPEEAVFRFFKQKMQQSPAEEQRAEPVDSLAASRDALARARSRLMEKQAKDAANDQQRLEHRRSDAYEERRRQDRRQNQQDVLLDTRATPSRRKSGPYPEIDTEA
ncbi:MAG: hypothetical protein QMB52_12025 [Propionivibrio sp.]